MQAQKSLALSYSFNLEEYLEDEEISSHAKLPSISELIQNRQKKLPPLLEQNIADLVQDAEPIRKIFMAIKDQLQPNLLEALNQAANIKDHAPKVKKAHRILADCNTLLAKKDSNK